MKLMKWNLWLSLGSQIKSSLLQYLHSTLFFLQHIYPMQPSHNVYLKAPCEVCDHFLCNCEWVPVLFIVYAHEQVTHYILLLMVSHYATELQLLVTHQEMQQWASECSEQQECQSKHGYKECRFHHSQSLLCQVWSFLAVSDEVTALRRQTSTLVIHSHNNPFHLSCSNWTE